MRRSLDVPTVRQCRKRLKRKTILLMVNGGLSILFFTFILLVMWLALVMEHPYRVPLAVPVWALLVYYLRTYHRTVLRRVHTLWKLLEEEDDPGDLGDFTAQGILEIFEDMKARMNMRRDTRLFTVDLFIPNAYASFFSDDVCIDRSWFRMLSPDELRALMAHELMHLKLRNERSPVYKKILRTVYALEAGILVGVVALFGFYSGVLLDLVLLAQFLFLFNMLFLIRGFPGRVTRVEEWLCDWAGAQYVSLMAAINFQLKSGQRYELNRRISRCLNVVLWSYRVPLKHYQRLYREIDRRLDREHLTPKRTRKMVKEVVAEMARELKWKRSWISSQTSFRNEGKKPGTTHKVNWLRYDTHIRDFQLDARELEGFVQDIVADRRSVLFRSSVDKSTSSHGSHPSTKQRVLFLYKNQNLLQQPQIPLKERRKNNDLS